MASESQYGGVPQGNEGLILQRGGEEMLLCKTLDRFTFRLETPNDASWQQGLSIESVTPIATTGLMAVKVKPEVLETAMQRARSHPAVQFVSHVYHPDGDPETLVYLRDQLTVQFGPTVSEARMTEIVQSLGLQHHKVVQGVTHAFVCQVTAAAQMNPIKLANDLLHLPEVLIAETNVVMHQRPSYRPQDTLYPQQWYLFNTGGTNVSPTAHIDVERAWDMTRGDRAIVVAITDDSIDLNHPDFQGIGKIVAPRDLAGKDFVPLPELETENHGTAVAGVAIAEETGDGIVGVAPGCALMPIRTTGFLDDESIETLFQWATDQGAAVICCSWGPGAVRFPLSLRQRAAITNAATRGRDGKGCIILFAAGNFNRPLNATTEEKDWPAGTIDGRTTWLNGFATHPDVIAVSACTSLGRKAAYSNWGAEVFVAAPSNNASPAIWFQQTGFIAAPPPVRTSLSGLGILTADRVGDLGYTTGDFTETFGGTSSATPVVAGVVALMLSANPDLSVTDVKEILRQTADKIVDPDPDPQLGLRLGTYNANGHSAWFGYGKVNAFKAVQAAQQRLQQLPAPQRQIEMTSQYPIAISAQKTITSQILVADVGTIGTVAIDISIDHEFLGDVEIFLIAPDVEPLLLQGRTLGRQTRLEKTYTPETTPMLRSVLGRSVRGLWELQVNDRAPVHTGMLNRWQLKLGV